MKFAFWVNVICAGINLAMLSEQYNIPSLISFCICSGWVVFIALCYPCEVELHNYGKWRNYLLSYQIRDCINCGKSQTYKK